MCSEWAKEFSSLPVLTPDTKGLQLSLPDGCQTDCTDVNLDCIGVTKAQISYFHLIFFSLPPQFFKLASLAFFKEKNICILLSEDRRVLCTNFFVGINILLLIDERVICWQVKQISLQQLKSKDVVFKENDNDFKGIWKSMKCLIKKKQNAAKTCCLTVRITAGVVVTFWAYQVNHCSLATPLTFLL